MRTFNSLFHNEEGYGYQGAEFLKFIKLKLKSGEVKIYVELDPKFTRPKRTVDKLVEARKYRNRKCKVNYAVIDYKDFNAPAFGKD